MKLIRNLAFLLILHSVVFISSAHPKDSTSFSLDSSLLILKRDTAQKLEVNSDFWQNEVYNPYKSHSQKFPFCISFLSETYASPILRNKVITSRYGWRNNRAHRGIDIDLITGDDVKSMFEGKVRYVRYRRGHGKIVVIRHPNGLETGYAHLSKTLVKANELVKKGQVIGKGGNTGNSRGSHLHLEVSYQGVFINPEYLFKFDNSNKIRANSIWVTKEWASPALHSSKKQSEIVVCKSYDEAMKSKVKKIHIIRSGDTLWDISIMYGVTIDYLCRLNSIAKNSILRIGYPILISR
ncbi:M23 family metallopeptidase [Reichenbachiella versicolor]|uniref:M23 family metallopeptidase n=1 Tax=Reichenbachiella versicolor TaxID=1821036 RepID=UPI000D6E518B|nr:M23 family metallopeptidase [Reichenbachiella versicolor]